MNLNTNFTIPEESLWWRPAYWPYKNNEIFLMIESFSKFIFEQKNNIAFRKEIIDIWDYYQCLYTDDCLKGENNISQDINLDEIREIISQGLCGNRNQIKIRNVFAAVTEIFPDPFKPSWEDKKFTVELAKKLHKIVGQDLWENTGQYRNYPASPSKENYEFVKPEKINDKMNSLFAETRALMKNNNNVENSVKIGAMFFTIFLDIHPFSNGNGRIARLLLSLILSHSCIVPVSLYQFTKCRDVYLNCLRESRTNSILRPSALSAYILESALINIEKCIDILGIFLVCTCYIYL